MMANLPLCAHCGTWHPMRDAQGACTGCGAPPSAWEGTRRLAGFDIWLLAGVSLFSAAFGLIQGGGHLAPSGMFIVMVTSAVGGLATLSIVTGFRRVHWSIRSEGCTATATTLGDTLERADGAGCTRRPVVPPASGSVLSSVGVFRHHKAIAAARHARGLRFDEHALEHAVFGAIGGLLARGRIRVDRMRRPAWWRSSGATVRREGGECFEVTATRAITDEPWLERSLLDALAKTPASPIAQPEVREITTSSRTEGSYRSAPDLGTARESPAVFLERWLITWVVLMDVPARRLRRRIQDDPIAGTDNVPALVDALIDLDRVAGGEGALERGVRCGIAVGGAMRPKAAP